MFALKEAVGAEEIRRREHAIARRMLRSLAANPGIEILVGTEPERLAVVSLGLRHPRGLLHAGFVVAVLSDLFGIQARSGCFCAGPYIHRAHPIDAEWSERMHACAASGELGAKLTFTRLSFPYHVSDAELGYVQTASSDSKAVEIRSNGTAARVTTARTSSTDAASKSR